jgi:hypothetical protein
MVICVMAALAVALMISGFPLLLPPNHDCADTEIAVAAIKQIAIVAVDKSLLTTCLRCWVWELPTDREASKGGENSHRDGRKI